MTATEIAKAAREEGLSYGQYVWKHGLGSIVIVEEKYDPKKHRRCAFCGKRMEAVTGDYFHRVHKYCSYECSRAAATLRRHEKERGYAEAGE